MRHAYTFRSTKLMDACMLQVMEKWEIDRTSVIKLALYLLSIYMKKCDVPAQNLNALVRDIELKAPSDFPDYGTFAD
jgi:hypothetical protein